MLSPTEGGTMALLVIWRHGVVGLEPWPEKPREAPTIMNHEDLTQFFTPVDRSLFSDCSSLYKMGNLSITPTLPTSDLSMTSNDEEIDSQKPRMHAKESTDTVKSSCATSHQIPS